MARPGWWLSTAVVDGEKRNGMTSAGRIERRYNQDSWLCAVLCALCSMLCVGRRVGGWWGESCLFSGGGGRRIPVGSLFPTAGEGEAKVR